MLPPVIDGKRGSLMTYAIHAGKALDRFARLLEERGGEVVARTRCAATARAGGGRLRHRSLATVPA